MTSSASPIDYSGRGGLPLLRVDLLGESGPSRGSAGGERLHALDQNEAKKHRSLQEPEKHLSEQPDAKKAGTEDSKLNKARLLFFYSSCQMKHFYQHRVETAAYFSPNFV